MTEEQRWLSRRYITYKLFTNLWFVGAVWLYFYRLFMTDQQVGVLDGAAFAIGIMAEVPSGALADKFGRDKLVRLGYILMGAGMLIHLVGNFLPIFIGQSIIMIGASFVSGADDALFFERLKFNKESTDWRKLVTRASQVTLIGSVVAYTAGGYFHSINPRIPWVLTGVAFFIASLLVWSVKDNRSRAARQDFVPEVKDYLNNIVVGFRQFRLPKLWIYVPIILTVQGVFYAAGWGLLRLVLLDRFGFSPLLGAVAISICSLITVGLLGYMHKHAEELSEKRVITIISMAAAASLLLSVANIGLWGFFVMFVLYAGEHVLHPFMSEVLNNHAPEDQRATVLSVASFIRMLPYIFLAPIIGVLNSEGFLEYFLIIWAALIGIALVIYLSNKKRDEQIKLTQE